MSASFALSAAAAPLADTAGAGEGAGADGAGVAGVGVAAGEGVGAGVVGAETAGAEVGAAVGALAGAVVAATFAEAAEAAGATGAAATALVAADEALEAALVDPGIFTLVAGAASLARASRDDALGATTFAVGDPAFDVAFPTAFVVALMLVAPEDGCAATASSACGRFPCGAPSAGGVVLAASARTEWPRRRFTASSKRAAAALVRA